MYSWIAKNLTVSGGSTWPHLTLLIIYDDMFLKIHKIWTISVIFYQLTQSFCLVKSDSPSERCSKCASSSWSCTSYTRSRTKLLTTYSAKLIHYLIILIYCNWQIDYCVRACTLWITVGRGPSVESNKKKYIWNINYYWIQFLLVIFITR